MQTIVELPEFRRKADKLISETEKQSIINYLAAHPQSGVIMQGTGGIRKFRWHPATKVKVAALGLSTIFTTKPYRCFCSQYSVKTKKPIYPSLNAMYWQNLRNA